MLIQNTVITRLEAETMETSVERRKSRDDIKVNLQHKKLTQNANSLRVH